MIKHNSPINMDSATNLTFLSMPTQSENVFENTYIQLRKAEKRIFIDDELKQLPSIHHRHSLYKEWKMRENSAKKITGYIGRNNGLLLDVGCGNGWLSAYIAKNTPVSVYGIDINKHELEQAVRVFGKQNKLKFFYGDIFKDVFPSSIFDFILLSSCIQYFEEAAQLINRMFYFLKEEGSIIISDSPMYNNESIQKARENSQKYYQSIGFENMSRYYFHQHENSIMKPFKAKYIFNPNNLCNRIGRKLFFSHSPPFPLISIQK